MPLKIAIMGLRHGHIQEVINALKNRKDAVLAAICEEDAETRKRLLADRPTDMIFDSYAKMLDTVECDVVGVGDYYGKRGSIIVEALKRGKHVIGDKPICTRLSELAEIESLARAKRLRVGCQLSLRDTGLFLALRDIVRSGQIGEIQAISFGGQHPLSYKYRPPWYFEEGKHGGTINDIAIHAFDLIPWLTGLRFARIQAARTWHVRPPQAPHFHDAAQMMLTMENGCGVLGDVSYFAPDSFGYSLPQYWRVTLWGTSGVAETHVTADSVTLYRDGEKEAQRVAPLPNIPVGYLESFFAEIQGRKKEIRLSTEEVLYAGRATLLTQEAADKGLTNVDIV
jgi:predicted dehydrogenase